MIDISRSPHQFRVLRQPRYFRSNVVSLELPTVTGLVISRSTSKCSHTRSGIVCHQSLAAAGPARHLAGRKLILLDRKCRRAKASYGCIDLLVRIATIRPLIFVLSSTLHFPRRRRLHPRLIRLRSLRPDNRQDGLSLARRRID